MQLEHLRVAVLLDYVHLLMTRQRTHALRSVNGYARKRK